MTVKWRIVANPTAVGVGSRFRKVHSDAVTRTLGISNDF